MINLMEGFKKYLNFPVGDGGGFVPDVEGVCLDDYLLPSSAQPSSCSS